MHFNAQIFKLSIFVLLCDIDFVGIRAKYLLFKSLFEDKIMTFNGHLGHFQSSNFRPTYHPEFISGSCQNIVNTPLLQDAETSSA